MFELYIFLIGYILGIVSYVFVLEDTDTNENKEKEIVEKYETKCKKDLLQLYENRLKQD
tara:strand:- start:88 stop:264 length:177 start_codon:yes stop_codon:yes gene_type:complete